MLHGVDLALLPALTASLVSVLASVLSRGAQLTVERIHSICLHKD